MGLILTISVGMRSCLKRGAWTAVQPAIRGVASLRQGAGGTGRHLLGAANGRKLYLINSRENSDSKFHVCLRAIKTKHYNHQRVAIVGTVRC